MSEKIDPAQVNVNCSDGIFETITVLKAQCAEKDAEITRLLGLVRLLTEGEPMIEAEMYRNKLEHEECHNRTMVT